MQNMFDISSDQLRAEFRPDLGGRLVSFSHSGHGHIIRPLLDGMQNPLDWPKAGAFPLIPFHGRLAGPAFAFLDRTYVLTGNPLRGGDALHGPAHLRPWSVLNHSPNAITLFLDYAADDDWPFPFHAEQSFTVTSSKLEVSIRLRNSGSSPMAGGIGWHPYFLGEAGDEVTCDANRHWIDVHLPSRKMVACQGRSSLQMSNATATEHFSQFTSAELTSATRTVYISAKPSLTCLVLHKTNDYICIEPASHVAGVFSYPEDLRKAAGFCVLDPGQEMTGSITVEIT